MLSDQTVNNVGSDVARMSACKIFIVGDLILDTYLSGRVSRISPEAPVPVVLEEKHWAVLGGAANVAANVAAFGAQAFLCGRIGDDADGKRFRELAAQLKIDIQSVISSQQIPTTRKLRVMAGYQQVVRVDSETTEPISADVEANIEKAFQKFLQMDGAKALVISDYGKGVCSPQLLASMIRFAQGANVPVITDPKSLDMKRYAGTTVIKPNLSEGRELLKVAKPGAKYARFEDEIEAVFEVLLKGSGAQNVVLSLSERGVAVRGKNLSAPVNFSSAALQVADVSGAGDTMVAFLAMGMAAGIGVARSVQLANVAAGIVCGKLGTATLSATEFLQVFEDDFAAGALAKIRSGQELVEILAKQQRAGKKVVFTNGCFDLLHAGHIEILQKAKAFGDILVVALNSDRSVRSLKGASRPLQNEDDRLRIIAALGCVDHVILFSDETPLALIQLLKPDVLIKGGDYTTETIVGAKEVLARGGRVEVVPLVPGRSTTSLVEKSKQPK